MTTTNEKVHRAAEIASTRLLELHDAAKRFAETGDATDSDALVLAAKKKTNADHALGRAQKALRAESAQLIRAAKTGGM